MKNNFAIVSLSVLILTACGADKRVPLKQQIKAPSSSELFALARESVEAQVRLADIRDSTAAPRHDVINVIPNELKRTIDSAKWAGPLHVIARDVAKEAGYSLVEYGNRKPVIISVDWQDKITVVDALADIGVRAGVRAVVEVDPNLARVVVYYD